MSIIKTVLLSLSMTNYFKCCKFFASYFPDKYKILADPLKMYKNKSSQANSQPWFDRVLSLEVDFTVNSR